MINNNVKDKNLDLPEAKLDLNEINQNQIIFKLSKCNIDKQIDWTIALFFVTLY